MKTTEQEYIDSYSRPAGCFAIVAAAVVLVMLFSIALNIALLIKLSQI
jgi:hypothetical protein